MVTPAPPAPSEGLPAWPKAPENYPQMFDKRLQLTSLGMLVDYERALSAAYEARLKLAVERLQDADKALTRTYDLSDWPGEGSGCATELSRSRVRATLAAIGPLPASRDSRESLEGKSE